MKTSGDFDSLSIVALLEPKKVNQGHNTFIHVSRQQAQKIKTVPNEFC